MLGVHFAGIPLNGARHSPELETYPSSQTVTKPTPIWGQFNDDSRRARKIEGVAAGDNVLQFLLFAELRTLKVRRAKGIIGERCH